MEDPDEYRLRFGTDPDDTSFFELNSMSILNQLSWIMGKKSLEKSNSIP
jgi:hypothetical protein